jgi:hypothetical protein
MALTTLVGLMESERSDFVVIMAGYPKDMERLFAANSGLRYVFP